VFRAVGVRRLGFRTRGECVWCAVFSGLVLSVKWFGAQCAVPMVQESGLRAQGSGVRVQGSGAWIQGVGCGV